ncbi:MAG: hypothetical protein WC358_09815 [Ignavibacteria bacterium]|jgi:cell surface protein SprA
MLARKIFVIFVLFLVTLIGCNESVTTFNSSGQNNVFSIPAWDYSDNHYFIDTLYKRSFLIIMNDSTGLIPQFVLDNKIRTGLPSFQVWVQCDNTHPNKKTAVAWIYLPERPINGYDTSFKRIDAIPDTCFYGFFRELIPSEYYINPLAGFIGLKINVPENYCVAVTYETYGGKKYGKGKYDVAGNEMMILKTIKCSNQTPDATPRAWELKMKNVYRLPYYQISNTNFKLDVFLQNNNYSYQSNIPGHKLTLSQMLLIDRYTGGIKIWNPDGLFDWIEGRTIIPETGDIIFPTLYPFGDDLGKFASDSILLFREIYSRRKSVVSISIQSNYYHIRGYVDTLK